MVWKRFVAIRGELAWRRLWGPKCKGAGIDGEARGDGDELSRTCSEWVYIKKGKLRNIMRDPSGLDFAALTIHAGQEKTNPT